MRSSWRPLAGAVVLAAAVTLVPQRGDSTPDPVNHPEWARMMLRGLGLGDALAYADPPPRAFAILSWRQSEWLHATEFIAGSEHGVALEPGSPALLRSWAALGEASFPVTVARPGEYRLRVRMAGEATAPATVNVVPMQGGAARSCTLGPVPARGWVEAQKPLRLHPGAYRATVALPKGTVFELMELAPRCIAPIEPLGGWATGEVLDAEDLAVTLLRAVDRERDLPPADAPIEAAGSEFEAEGRPAPSARLEGGTAGARATVSLDVPGDGLYSLSAFGVRTAGQRWAADDCRTAVTCPLPSRLPSWWVVMTVALSAGHHRFTVDLGPGDFVGRVRLERRKDGGADYVDTLRRLGFDPGEGPVSRARADDALSWLGKRHRIELSEVCYEPERPVLERVAGAGAEWQQPVAELPATPPTTLPPVTPPATLPPATPPATLPPATPPATLPPGPPPTLPCQPPSSPTVPDPCGGR
jgi:hypothetical protein